MANLSKTKTLFAFTSPRTIEKIIPEIFVLIDSFEGYKWNKETQIEYFHKLFRSEFYEGDKMPGEIALAARDRITRAPKALGFINLKPTIELTAVGKQLLSGKRTSDIITKQLLKFQLPSPYHRIPVDRNFNVKPYLELLRLIKEVGSLSKIEIAIFFVQIIHFEKFNSVVDSINKFRNEISLNKGNRKAFIDDIFTQEIFKIYADEIRLNELSTRESNESTLAKFLKTKKSNQIDYADAFMRYLRATQLVTFDKKTFRIIIAPSRIEEVNYILTNVERGAISFKTEDQYKRFLFDPLSLTLLTDRRSYLEEKLKKLNIRFVAESNTDSLKDLLELGENTIIIEAIQETELSLKDYKEFDNIIEVFDKIILKEVPDPPLYLEWNIWRSLVMLNFAKEVKGNFRIDLDGVPLNTAIGNMPDIEVEYDTFKLMIEVTMSSGNKQYEMEGEPVPRHFGKIQNSSNKPVYCLFVAPKISEGTLAHFFNLNRFNTKAYGGKTRIIPMNLRHFIDFISTGRDYQFSNSQILLSYLEEIIQNNLIAQDESIWHKEIQDSIPLWCYN